MPESLAAPFDACLCSRVLMYRISVDMSPQVLHSLLEPDTENDRVAVVGISNWMLDFAKVRCKRVQ